MQNRQKSIKSALDEEVQNVKKVKRVSKLNRRNYFDDYNLRFNVFHNKQ